MVFTSSSTIAVMPLQVVQSLFATAGTKEQKEFKVAGHFREQLSDPALLAQVQDMGNPEYYYGAVQGEDGVWLTTKYHGDTSSFNLAQCAGSCIWERRPVFCVPVPGLSPWCEPPAHSVNTGSSLTSPAHAKRGRPEPPTAMEAELYEDEDTVLLHEVVEVHPLAPTAPTAAGGSNGTLPSYPFPPGPSSTLQPALSVSQLRAAAVQLLQGSLGGDALAAEAAGSGPLGIPALNLTRCPAAPPPPASSRPTPSATHSSELGEGLRSALALLLPLVSYLALSVEGCNNGQWAPRRDYDTNRLSSLLLVDETTLGPGQLQEAGIASFQALKGCLQDQGPGLPGGVDPTLLPGLRTYLAASAQLPYSIGESMTDRLQAEFVATRKADPAFSPEMFHTRLTLARAVCLSYGETELNEVRWRHVLDLEARREARLRVV
ncbi:uncharacterized protein HaLaN_06152 [Haematococcus lacustris]|uniref:Uncharacterized protein n=1 Tax=Haematococcus lacustris TaxID=44745 RepID=A0A699YUW1_HAELA|nr:uncharacterized protein HaLaN_06152 [Haematococcus lacustris]